MPEAHYITTYRFLTRVILGYDVNHMADGADHTVDFGIEQRSKVITNMTISAMAFLVESITKKHSLGNVHLSVTYTCACARVASRGNRYRHPGRSKLRFFNAAKLVFPRLKLVAMHHRSGRILLEL